MNLEVANDLYKYVGEDLTKLAQRYVQLKRVEMGKIEYKDENNFTLHSKVAGRKIFDVYIEIGNGKIKKATCNCEKHVKNNDICKHIVATMKCFETMEKPKQKQEQEQIIKRELKYRMFYQLIKEFDEEQETKDTISIASKLNKEEIVELKPKLIFDKTNKNIKVELLISIDKEYRIKNLVEFYDNIQEQKVFKYGEKLEFLHKKTAFKQESRLLLEFVLKHAEIIKYVNSNSNYGVNGKALKENYILLSKADLDELFEILKGQDICIEREYKEEKIELIPENPVINWEIEKLNNKEYKLIPDIDVFKLYLLQGKKYTYILTKEALYKCDENFTKTIIKLLQYYHENYAKEIIFGKEELPEFFSVLNPLIKKYINIDEIDIEDKEKYKPKDLQIKVYLDFDKNDYMTAEIKFCYGNYEFNPFDEKNSPHIPRDRRKEAKAFQVFMHTGFMIDTKNLQLILPKEEKIYHFLTEDIETYMQKFEILATDNFKNKQIAKPKISNIGVKVENNLLSIDLSKLNIDLKELKQIMEQYRLKKKYHKLKNGDFLSLENNKDLNFIDKLVQGMDLSYDELTKGKISIPISRTLYLDQILKNMSHTEVSKNKDYKEIVDNLNKERLEENVPVPKKLKATLRYYQKTGYRWLSMLDKYHFGGILADDMGLGKTVQLLSVIVAYNSRAKQEEKRVSMVVCPSSLTLNWKNEANKFAPNLKTMVINGSALDRKEKIKNIEKYDLVITSYDLLKRDIEEYRNKNYTFRYMIADEAQYLKNSNTQNAKSVKEIKAETRYALTGTPIENSLAELWSIFDFIMPGYLYTYRKFKALFEIPITKDQNKKATRRLKMLIETFILRRTKKEVLTELPEKSITVLYNEMQKEQKDIYLSYLSDAKKEVSETIGLKGFEKSQIKILAVLTRLRQICCHPSLFIRNYNGSSSKLEQCMEIIKEGVRGNHKILLFSGYTSMFSILKKELKKENIPFFALTGSTKVDERVQMVDEFNENNDIKVFLISLKAGGTGLNLTGADMVIHYDPWWNVSSENQATDRAYRIGQKNNVQVYKLITKNSIEEKIYDLQQKKSELIDNMLDTKTVFINKLTKKDIMKLFD